MLPLWKGFEDKTSEYVWQDIDDVFAGIPVVVKRYLKKLLKSKDAAMAKAGREMCGQGSSGSSPSSSQTPSWPSEGAEAAVGDVPARPVAYYHDRRNRHPGGWTAPSRPIQHVLSRVGARSRSRTASRRADLRSRGMACATGAQGVVPSSTCRPPGQLHEPDGVARSRRPAIAGMDRSRRPS